MINPHSILENSRNILLVDWPNPSFPRALLLGGFGIFGFSPSNYTRASIVSLSPDDLDEGSIFPPVNEEEQGYLIFRQLKDKPSAIDIVCVYRPMQEFAGIFADLILPLGAKTVWIQPPVVSAEARILVENNGLNYIESYDIKALVRGLRDRT